MRYSCILLILFILSINFGIFADAASQEVRISHFVSSVEVLHQGEVIAIQRNQDEENTINPAYAKTSRQCPPFCIQPSSLGSGIETVAELEVLDYLNRIRKGDDTIVVIDSRPEEWMEYGTIPGTINIPWTTLDPAHADPVTVDEIIEKVFNGRKQDGRWDFSAAKTLVLFCSGLWCGLSSANIHALRDLGYPADKLKWYRGGMQAWETVGLTTVKSTSGDPTSLGCKSCPLPRK